MIETAGVLLNGELLPNTFPDIIKAGQWAYAQGYSPDNYRIVLLLPNGQINHRAIIQIYDYKQGRIMLENHYTTCGTFHLPMEQYEQDKKLYETMYKDNDKIKVSAWIDS